MFRGASAPLNSLSILGDKKSQREAKPLLRKLITPAPLREGGYRSKVGKNP